MELTSTRKKANAITSSILNRIAIRVSGKSLMRWALTNLKFHDGKAISFRKWGCYWRFWSGVLRMKSWQNWQRKLRIC